MSRWRYRFVPLLAFTFASAATFADGGLEGATRVGGILGGGPRDLLIFAYTSPRALFITIEDFSPEVPVKIIHAFEVAPAKSNAVFLGALDCQVDGRKIAGLIAETKFPELANIPALIARGSFTSTLYPWNRSRHHE